MPISVHFGMEAVYGFLLTLTRVGSALTLLPLPGIQNAPQVARIVLIIATTLCLFPLWPAVTMDDLNGGGFLLAVLAEMSIGLLMGLSLSFLSEAFQLGAQAISFQTGFSFASTFDPSSQADSGVFQVFSQLACGLLFFALGIHLQLIQMFARSMTAFSFDQGHFKEGAIALIIHQGSTMFVSGLKLALPVVALLFLVDQALSAISRLQSQLQLLSLAFPAKILLSLLFLATVLTRWPTLYGNWARDMLGGVFQVFSVR